MGKFFGRGMRFFISFLLFVTATSLKADEQKLDGTLPSCAEATEASGLSVGEALRDTVVAPTTGKRAAGAERSALALVAAVQKEVHRACPELDECTVSAVSVAAEKAVEKAAGTDFRIHNSGSRLTFRGKLFFVAGTLLNLGGVPLAMWIAPEQYELAVGFTVSTINTMISAALATTGQKTLQSKLVYQSNRDPAADYIPPRMYEVLSNVYRKDVGSLDEQHREARDTSLDEADRVLTQKFTHAENLYLQNELERAIEEASKAIVTVFRYGAFIPQKGETIATHEQQELFDSIIGNLRWVTPAKRAVIREQVLKNPRFGNTPETLDQLLDILMPATRKP